MPRHTNPAAQGVAERRQTMEEQNAEYYARVEAMRPTPTQEENDLARVGALDIDNKQHDGSEPDHVTVNRMMTSRFPDNQPYQNRALGTAGDERSNAAQKRGAKAARKSVGKAPVTRRGPRKASAKATESGSASSGAGTEGSKAD